MPFFQVDDQLPQSRKTRQLVESVLDGDTDGLAAIGLWTLAGAQAQVLGGGTDGLVSRADLVRVILNPEVADRLARSLVNAGFWHAPGHQCARCPAVPQGHWLYHDWFMMGYTPAAQATVNKAKRQELKDPKLIAQVWARDCVDPETPTIGRCRYCGTEVRRKAGRGGDTRSEKQPQLDHVDPRKAAGITNVVLACSTCNRNKGNRTPREAGMTLLPPPRPALTTPAQGDGDTACGPRDDAKASVGSSHGQVPPSRGSQAPGVAHQCATRSRSDEVSPADRPVPTQRADGHVRPSEDRSLRMRPGATAGTGPLTNGPPTAELENQSSAMENQRPNQPSRDGPEVPAARGPGQGQGQGVGWGVGKGERSGLPQPDTQREPASKSSRRRKRRKSRSSSADSSTDDTPEDLDAGEPPPGVLAPAGGQGSPWHGWHGPPSTVVETDCPTHNQPEPCQKCGRELEENHAPPPPA